jgi:dolichol-phosphate mannosyltransferase
MVTSGDYVRPTLNREPFYDKPPLFYWLVAAAFHLRGTTEWAARGVPALAAWLTVLCTFFFGRRALGTRAGLLAGIALALMPLFTLCGRVVILDSLLTFFVSVALFTAREAVQGPRIRWPWWIASSVACALGVLTKGPVAFVLLAPPLAAYVWLNRDKARPSLVHWMAFGGLGLALVAPWYVAIIARDPGFAYHFFIDQHLVRFFLKQYHVEPVWYFAPVLLIGCLPWSFLLVPFARFLGRRSATARALRPEALGYYVLWASWCLVFFSISSSKLAPYVLPALPALALLAGCYLEQVLFQKSLPGLFQLARNAAPRLAAAALCAALLVLSLGGWHLGLIGPREAFFQAGLCTVCVIALAWAGRRIQANLAWLLCCALVAITMIDSAHRLLPAWSQQRSPLKRYPEIREWAPDQRTPVVCYGGEWGSIPFYLGRNESVINFGDLAPGQLPELLSPYHRWVLVTRHKADLELFRHAMAPVMEIAKVLAADEIAVALVENKAWTELGHAGPDGSTK